MPIGYYSDVVKILKKHGFELDRQSKHEVWENPEPWKLATRNPEAPKFQALIFALKINNLATTKLTHVESD